MLSYRFEQVETYNLPVIKVDVSLTEGEGVTHPLMTTPDILERCN